jgi:hypothetical protein
LMKDLERGGHALKRGDALWLRPPLPPRW